MRERLGGWIGVADDMLWVWYVYGEPRSYKNTNRNLQLLFLA